MKKKILAYFSGVFATVLVLTMVTTALAASGKATFNFVNVSLRGERKIAAGADITVANGQKVPSSILYTDEKGGKTNYLPIRAISELLGVEIKYDSATKTVQLEKQPTAVDAGALGQWSRSFEANMVGYTMSGCNTTQYTEAPMWRPTWLPDGWKLSGFSVESPSNALIKVSYQPDTDIVNNNLSFESFAPSNRICRDFLGNDVDAASMLQKATVNGLTADFFKTKDFNLLVWADTEGNLFKLRGNLDQASLEQIANSVKEVGKDMLPKYDMKWTPAGSSKTSRNSVSGLVKETWKDADDVSFEIRKGEIFGIIGESGSGKSTIGKCVLNLQSSDSGEIIFDGQDIFGYSQKKMKPLRKDMQMVFQNPLASFNPKKRLGKTFAEYGKFLGMTDEQYQNRMKGLLKYIKLSDDVLSRLPKELSGGQLQRLAIARALMSEPKFVLADEPVSALDVSVQAQILNLMIDLKENLGQTMLFISHDLNVVRHLCDRVAVVYLGVIVEMGPIDAVYSNVMHPYTQALISAKPKEHPLQQKEQIILKGDIPTAIDVPEGCRFASRCSRYKHGLCDHRTPKLKDMGNGHFVACHYPKGHNPDEED